MDAGEYMHASESSDQQLVCLVDQQVEYTATGAGEYMDAAASSG